MTESEKEKAEIAHLWVLEGAIHYHLKKAQQEVTVFCPIFFPNSTHISTVWEIGKLLYKTPFTLSPFSSFIKGWSWELMAICSCRQACSLLPPHLQILNSYLTEWRIYDHYFPLGAGKRAHFSTMMVD
jgi:hypothetical protein